MAIGADDVGVQECSCRDQPGVVLAQSLAGAALDVGTPLRVRPMKTLNRESLESCERRGFVIRALQQLLDRYHRNHELATAQGWQEFARWADPPLGGLALQID